MISIAVFNNKGGVGKTTLTCNLASFVARERKKRVIVVDCDPQCNATQLIMGQDFAGDLYTGDHANPSVTSIRDILKPIEDGDAGIDEVVKPISSSDNRFDVALIPGHPSLSTIEDLLGGAWHVAGGGDLGGIRKSNWNSALTRVLSSSYDFGFFDLGPSLGSINRSVLIGCDRFITPMGSDIFSILGIRNIASWFSQWLDRYDNALTNCEKQAPGRLEAHGIAMTLPIKHGFSGYTMQQYIAKAKGGQRRPTRAYEEILKQVPAEIGRSLGPFFADDVTVESAALGDVPHLYSLIPLAQSVAAPILDLRAKDGPVGSQFSQKDEYARIVTDIARRLGAILGVVL